MKRKLKITALILCLMMALASLSACEFLPKPIKFYNDGDAVTITLNYNDGTTVGTLDAVIGEPINTPNDPTRTHYVFTGWFTDENLTARYDFAKDVTREFTLYAGWVLDGVTLTNTISTQTMKGVVKIENICQVGLNQKGAQGSGFCFKVSGGKYYILTNSHVVEKLEGAFSQTFKIYDYQGNDFTGHVIADNPAKDLACLYFSATADDTETIALPLASSPKVNDDVIALGAPLGQVNCITFGKVKAVNVSVAVGEDNPTIFYGNTRHDAFTDHGSSGGPLINPDMQVVGVTFAGNEETKIGYALPMSAVNEFLETYVYNS